MVKRKGKIEVLFIDTDQTTVAPISQALSQTGMDIFVATNLDTALFRFDNQVLPIVFIDLGFHELDALSLIQKFRGHEAREKRTASFVIMKSGPLKKEQEALMEEMNDIEVIQKPLGIGAMISQIERSLLLNKKRTLKANVMFDISNRFNNTGDFDEAIESVKASQRILGDDYYPFLLELYKEKGAFKEAQALMEQMPENALDPLTKYNQLGEISLKLGRFEEAKEYYEKADSIAPKNIERITNMVDVYLALKDPQEAVQKQMDLLELHPEDPEMKFDLFKKLEDADFSDEAAAFCRKSSRPKEVVKYFNNKGVMMVKTEQFEEAISEYERALNYYPKNKENHLIYFNMALGFLKMKKSSHLKDAIKCLEGALEVRPDFEKAKSLLERVRGKYTKESA